jgi:hypothetical protein
MFLSSEFSFLYKCDKLFLDPSSDSHINTLETGDVDVFLLTGHRRQGCRFAFLAHMSVHAVSAVC